MSWFQKLFGGGETRSANSSLQSIQFGTYSDNNKPPAKIFKWGDMEDAFMAKKYADYFHLFFDYIKDDQQDNVHCKIHGERFTFELVQETKKVRGACDGRYIRVEAPVMRMEHPDTTVMRRLLELNFDLNYSRAAINDDNVLAMVFESPVETAFPNKLYNGIREAAVQAVRQSNFLLLDFNSRDLINEAVTVPVPADELDVKYNYFRHSIEEVEKSIAPLNPDYMSGVIGYCLLGTIYHLSYLISPKGSLTARFSRVHNIFMEGLPPVEQNRKMLDGLKKLLHITKEEFAHSMYRSKATFARNNTAEWAGAKNHIYNGVDTARWCLENNYLDLALYCADYGMSHNQDLFSMPRVVTELYHLYMMIRHSEYFAALGWKQKLYDIDKDKFDKAAIRERIKKVIRQHRKGYPHLQFNMDALKFDDIIMFGISYFEQVADMDLTLQKN